MTKKYDGLDEEGLLEVFRVTAEGMSNEELDEIIEEMQSKGLKGSIIAIDDPESDEARATMEYIEFHKKLPKLTKKEIAWAQGKIGDKSAKLNDLKRAIMQLGHSGKIESLRFLEKFAKNREDGLRIWAENAVGECKMFIESDLTGRPTISVRKLKT